MASFEEILLSQRPDVRGHPVNDWWQLWGANELRRRLAELGRQDVLQHVGDNNDILRDWYQLWGSNEYPNIWTAPAAPSYAEQMAQGIVDKVSAPADFSKYMAWEQFFDPELARAAASQRAEGYYLPILEQNIDAVRGDMANRGLFRSGIRNRAETRQMEDIADLEQTMIEQLYGQREGEAREHYSSQQQMYEKDPTGYKPSDQVRQAKNYSKPTDYYGYRQDMYGSGPITNVRYGVGTTEGAPSRYGQSYRDWWSKKYGATK